MREVYKHRGAVRQVLRNMDAVNRVENKTTDLEALFVQKRDEFRRRMPDLPAEEFERRFAWYVQNALRPSNEKPLRQEIPFDKLASTQSRKKLRKDIVRRGRQNRRGTLG